MDAFGRLQCLSPLRIGQHNAAGRDLHDGQQFSSVAGSGIQHPGIHQLADAALDEQLFAVKVVAIIGYGVAQDIARGHPLVAGSAGSR